MASALALAVGCDSQSGRKDAPTTQRADAAGLNDGSAERPLRVVLVPADGGTEQGTIADFQPVFNAVSASTGLKFDLKVAASYDAVVQGMTNERVDVAFFGPVTYHRARQAGAAELLAVAVEKGESVYFSGIFVPADSTAKVLGDLKGKSVALGDVNSTSSFYYPIAMLIAAGVDPVKDLGKVYITGSHANALAALSAGKTDAAGCAFNSFEKAVTDKQIDPTKVRLLAKSEPIPYPPLAMHRKLPPELKTKLRDGFNGIHKQPSVKPEMIRGYGGKKVDRYNADYPESEFDAAMAKLAAVTDALKGEILKKAGQ
ncbi:phosphate/phosphite/phosphonate ABC transporter substrate-binding protein [Humisphaera borealis]|uniref:phosphate/phosphite/phosphonate ABC transporter substrate-binding protein n=1 Tax=Humisphaera borealis TaxID=2807512 RepID=UPI0019D0BEA8|nr:phosphate/phosphite/phosphonate ABC transporter substrate-binding protein [Humisphaera borealis]